MQKRLSGQLILSLLLLGSSAAAFEDFGRPNFSDNGSALKPRDDLATEHPASNRRIPLIWEGPLPSQEFRPIPISQIESAPLITEKELVYAELSADKYFAQGSYEVAAKLFTRITQSRRIRDAHSDLLAEALEDQAAADIAASFPLAIVHQLRGFHISLSGDIPLFETARSLILSNSIISAQISDVKSIKALPNQTESVQEQNSVARAKSLLQEAISIRDSMAKESVFTIPALLMLAGIDEREGNLENALDLHRRALDIEQPHRGKQSKLQRHDWKLPSASSDFVAFCRRHNIRNLEQDMPMLIEVSKEQDPGLISAILKDLINDDPAKAVSLFEPVALFRKTPNTVIFLEPTLLALLPPIWPQEKADILNEYAILLFKERFARIEHGSTYIHRAHDAMLPKSHPNEVIVFADALEKRGWNLKARDLFQKCLSDADGPDCLPLLTKYAELLEQCNDLALAAEQYRRMLDIICRQQCSTFSEVNDRAFCLRKTESMIKAKFVSQSAAYAELKRTATHLASDSEAQAQNKQFLEISEQLLNDARAFENKDQFEQANNIFLRALAIRSQKIAPKSVEAAEVYSDLARVAAKQKHVESADQYFNKAIGIYRSLAGKPVRDFGMILEQYAGFLDNTGQKNKSEQISQEAIMIFRALDKAKSSVQTTNVR